MNAPLTALQALLMTQEHRLYKLIFPHHDGPSNPVFLENFDGVEKLNSAFEYKLKLISEDAHIELKDFMGKLATVELEQANSAAPRYFNGYVTSARHAGSDGGLSFYELVLSPWTSLLQHRRDHYIFHNQSLLASLEELFADYGQFNDHKFLVAHPGPQETFRVQYDESDFNYFNRRVEEKGWSYWFEHRADGHTLVISDDTSTQALPIEPGAQVRFQGGKTVTEKVDFIDQWNGARSLQPSKVAVQSFDFKQPHFPLYTEQSTNRVQGKVLQTEVYEYTGALAFANLGAGNELAALRLEEFEAQAKSFTGSGNHRALVPGRYFALTEHFEHDQEANPSDNEFLLLSVSHSGSNNYLQKGVDAVYRNRFSAMRRAVPYRPGRHANSQPVAAPGIQTATVVGPPGEEIHCDEFGRVKVQFHWDRAGSMNEKSSCWVRVSSPWAGSNYGGIQLPRIGQEVIVDFLNGNIDQPIIVGRTYNQAQMPPWSLPAQKNQSGFYSKSIGGGYDNANVLRFDDTQAAEELWLHAEKNQLTEVEHDEKKWVGNDRVKTIDRDETNHIKRDRTETVNHDEKITVHNDRTERVDHNEKISIGDNRTEDVGIDETISIGQNRSEQVGHNETIHIGHNRSEKVGSNEDITIGSNRSKTVGSNESAKIGSNWNINVGKMKMETIGIANVENVGMARMSNIGLLYSLNVGMYMNTIVGGSQNTKVVQDQSTDVGKKLTLTAGEEIVLECGKSILALKKDGTIFLNGVELNISAAGKPTTIHGEKVFLNPEAEAKVYKKADDNVQADAAPEGGAAGGAGASGLAAGAGSGPSTAAMAGALESGGGLMGTLSKFAGMAQQAVGLAGMAKQAVSLFSKDKGAGAPASAIAAAAPSLLATGGAGGAGAASTAATAARAAISAPVSAMAAAIAQVPLSDAELAGLAQQALFASSSVDLSTVALTKVIETAPEQIKAAVGQASAVQQQAQAVKAAVNAPEGMGAGLGTTMGQLGGGTKL